MKRTCQYVLLAQVGACLCSGCSFAQSISISVAQDLSFPTIAIPQSGTVDLAVSPLNSSTSGTATVLYGVASRGQYNLSTDGQGAAISTSVDITDVTVSDPEVTLSKFTGFYHSTMISEFPSPTMPLPETSPGSTPLYIGATISARPNVKPGTCTASFIITVIVQ